MRCRRGNPVTKGFVTQTIKVDLFAERIEGIRDREVSRRFAVQPGQQAIKPTLL